MVTCGLQLRPNLTYKVAAIARLVLKRLVPTALLAYVKYQLLPVSIYHISDHPKGFQLASRGRPNLRICWVFTDQSKPMQ